MPHGAKATRLRPHCGAGAVRADNRSCGGAVSALTRAERALAYLVGLKAIFTVVAPKFLENIGPNLNPIGIRCMKRPLRVSERPLDCAKMRDPRLKEDPTVQVARGEPASHLYSLSYVYSSL